MSSLEKLESAFAESAENHQFETINSLLSELTKEERGPSLNKCLEYGVNLIFDGYSDVNEGALNCVVLVMQNGIAPTLIRDYLSNAARKAFSAYPDPAGLLSAIACNDKSKAAERIASNWQALCWLLADYTDSKITGIPGAQKSIYCYAQKFGFGKIAEVDPVSDLIGVAFKMKQKFSLENFTAQCHLVVPGSLAHDLLEGKKYDVTQILASDLAPQLESCLLPPVKFTQALFTRILMTKYIKSVKAFQTWFMKKSLGTDIKTASAANSRNWGNSSSLAELNSHLPKEQITPGDEQKENLHKIFKFAANKPLQAQLYSELLCILWEACTEKSAIEGIVELTATEAEVWSNTEIFSAVTDKMGAKHLHAWFHVTINAKGVDWLVNNCLDLPNKYWNYMDKALEEFDGIEALTEVVRGQVKTGSVSPDTLLWMWARYKDQHEFLYNIIGNPALVIRALAREVRGNHIKASKDLRKLLMESEDFQRFVMDLGSDTGVSALVSAVRSMPALDLGEKQSLLVRIVRLYPEKKFLVEERKVEVSKREMDKITSICSYEERKAEIDDIVKNQIPQNTEAIGTARDYGDLRENFEFKAAKDKQVFLMSRRSDLEASLDEVKPTDYSEFNVTDRVIPGAVVVLTEAGTSKEYTILGLWDGAPEKGYIAYDTVLGKSLMGRKVGDVIAMPNGDDAEITGLSNMPEELAAELAKK